MADIIDINTPPQPEARPEEFIGEPVDWIESVDEDSKSEFLEQNAIHLFWIGINQLLLNGYPDVPNLMRLIADEVAWQQKHGRPNPDLSPTTGSTYQQNVTKMEPLSSPPVCDGDKKE